MTFDLTLSEEQDAVRDLARILADDAVSPAAPEAEAARGVADALWRTLLSTGLTAPVAPEHGGGGVPDGTSRLLAVEGLGFGDAAIAASAFWSGNAALLIGSCGTAEQRDAMLPAFVTDTELRAAVALYEGFGRAPSEYRTTIQAEGDRWRVRGRKTGVPLTAGGGPLIVVGTDPSAGDRLRAAVIPADDGQGEGGQGGVTVTASSPHLGLDAAPMSTVDLDVTVGERHLLGGPDADDAALAHEVSMARLTTAALAIGCAQRACEYASGYATERTAFGRPISVFQGVAFLMADARMRIDAARLQVWQAAAGLETTEAAGTERAVSHAVAYATSIASEVTRDCVQVLGGHGFLADHPVERWYRATASLTALDFDPTCLAFTPAL
ncbi:acyl-CoA dehydrogenase family protein [Streptomyces sp. GQFP]|uniref:acyl-CoA dehydrogenase family protein n=1 Tax=Streptomyces sp. GQFP TaxID=2907545 RepID=UPI001F3D2703|nr:acyl-CoA dehydrogenase family protein [Streptomyces sp. GQFP]UIX29162.1 acyl-CoA dehydrogenase family protein [Streptomyces sp. GQFP]